MEVRMCAQVIINFIQMFIMSVLTLMLYVCFFFFLKYYIFCRVYVYKHMYMDYMPCSVHTYNIFAQMLHQNIFIQPIRNSNKE